MKEPKKTICGATTDGSKSNCRKCYPLDALTRSTKGGITDGN